LETVNLLQDDSEFRDGFILGAHVFSGLHLMFDLTHNVFIRNEELTEQNKILLKYKQAYKKQK